MEWFQKILSKEWIITPAGGLTGDAYIATNGDKRLFLKRNSSPFLAVLSAEGIVPKLIWTRRMENGDVITAQEWMDGRTLNQEEMKQENVANLLYKIHYSSELLYMLMRLGKRPQTAMSRFIQLTNHTRIQELSNQHREIRQAIHILDTFLPVTDNKKLVVCHGDIDHHNIILDNSGQIYLVDWENAMIADPIIDYGHVLKWYIPKEDWNNWLKPFGISLHTDTLKRMYWYLIINCLDYLIWHYLRNETTAVQNRMLDLKELVNDVQTFLT
ncbi:phosphotransferase family protein [Cerasibacillus terrae]|uniref:Phosphotransferase family protein n=1 Tax=Cerasibacillus terrae TaxID=2498845 RepID=A0A5C8NH38_9BACI|nr:phosphotransferase family protein [Cerasibacillus terrae]TXL60570.1 phosphotransferase family protein [Cerasibacillus terrae]